MTSCSFCTFANRETNECSSCLVRRKPVSSQRRQYSIPLIIALSSLPVGSSYAPILASKARMATIDFHSARKSKSAHYFAKRNKNRRDDGSDDLNNWYDSVDDGATPDRVFWEEMERQRLFNQLGGDNSLPTTSGREIASIASTLSSSPSQSVMNGSKSSFTPMPKLSMGRGLNGSSGGAGGNGDASTAAFVSFDPTEKRKPPTMEEQKAAEATLSQYTMFQVSDNWLDDDLQAFYQQSQFIKGDEGEKVIDLEEETRVLVEQLEKLPDGYGAMREQSGFFDAEMEEPWDHYGDEDFENVDPNRISLLKMPPPAPDSEFYMDWDTPSDKKEDEVEFWERMKDCQTKSRRLEKAAASEKAKAYFQKEPNAREGYDQMWVSAIDNACFKSLRGNIRDYGIEFADNFGDFVDGAAEDGLYSIEDIASFKARKVFEVTGLPCIASRTSFEVEPIPSDNMSNGAQNAGPGVRSPPAKGVNNPRVLSGYKINDIQNHVEYIVEALKPMSEPNRVTRFTSCLCYYDGEMEIFEYGVCDVDILFCHSLRTFIPMSQAIRNMIETLKMTLDLGYQKILEAKREDSTMAGIFGSDDGDAVIGPASLKLRDRVLRDGRVLPNDIIDVSKFMDSQVDVNLMDECAKELADRFYKTKPTKILTVATTGLVIALPMAKYLQVPVVYARKERSVVMADTFKAAFASKTVGKNREFLVSKKHLDPMDRVLVIDDFLSSGASQEALLRIISDADATAVGVGVLLEKVYESGRQSLSGYNIPIQSLCRVASVKDGVIQLLEEEGFGQM